jgi:hypothetical protein
VILFLAAFLNACAGAAAKPLLGKAKDLTIGKAEERALDRCLANAIAITTRKVLPLDTDDKQLEHVAASVRGIIDRVDPTDWPQGGGDPLALLGASVAEELVSSDTDSDGSDGRAYAELIGFDMSLYADRLVAELQDQIAIHGSGEGSPLANLATQVGLSAIRGDIKEMQTDLSAQIAAISFKLDALDRGAIGGQGDTVLESLFTIGSDHATIGYAVDNSGVIVGLSGRVDAEVRSLVSGKVYSSTVLRTGAWFSLYQIDSSTSALPSCTPDMTSLEGEVHGFDAEGHRVPVTVSAFVMRAVIETTTGRRWVEDAIEFRGSADALPLPGPIVTPNNESVGIFFAAAGTIGFVLNPVPTLNL